jgi:predicted DNA binding CopG/RHH family protein
MKPALLTGMMLLLIASTTSAQLTLLPQVGFESAKTSLQYNGLPSFSPLGGEGSLKALARLDYRFKSRHGAFIGVGSSPAAVAFSFSNPADALTNYKAATHSLQWRFEGGYQYSTKPISFKNAAAKKAVANKPEAKVEYKKSCHSYASRYSTKNKTATTVKQDKSLNLRLQPSVGMAYIPAVKEDVSQNGNTYQYNAGNWKTAVVSGMGFEFGKGKERLLTLSAFYTKGLGTGGTKTITGVENGKASIGSFRSAASSWSVTLGVPFSLTKNKEAAPKATQKQSCKTYYSESNKSRCRRVI